MFRIVVTSYTTLQTDGPHRAAYAEAGCELVPGPFIRWSTEEELLESVTDCDAVLCTTDQFTERVFAAAPRLKIVSRFGVGYDTIDVEAATKHGVWVTITPGINHLAVADHTLALLLAVARQVVPLVNMVEAGGWDRPPGVELDGKTLGIIGFGSIGRQVARRAAGFGMRIIAHDIMEDAAAAAALGVTYASLDDLLAQSDFITLNLALTASARGLINAERIAKMKRGVYLINTSRGGAIDEPALAEALRSGHVAGAGLDVLDMEPPTDRTLIEMPQVIVTPHVAGSVHEANVRACAMNAEDVLAVMRGERPAHAVNDLG